MSLISTVKFWTISLDNLLRKVNSNYYRAAFVKMQNKNKNVMKKKKCNEIVEVLCSVLIEFSHTKP